MVTRYRQTWHLNEFTLVHVVRYRDPLNKKRFPFLFKVFVSISPARFHLDNSIEHTYVSATNEDEKNITKNVRIIFIIT